jgi:hypothetical protein
LQFYKHESCGKCTPCREGTYWISGLLKRLEKGEGQETDLEKIDDKCEIIKDERVAIKNKYNIKYRTNAKKNFESYQIVMIDTNVFLEDVPCYAEGGFANEPDKKEKQQNYVLGQTKTANKIVLIGHHPIDYIALKPKKPDAITITKGLVDLIRAIYAKNPNIDDFVYLCADNHYFQASTITVPKPFWHRKKRIVRQFIVGTGGAKLDAVPTDVLQEYVPDNNNNQTTIQVVNQESKHGFAKFSIDENGMLQCEFVSVPPVATSVAEAITPLPVGGSRRFRQKRRITIRKNRITIRKKKSSRPERNNRRPV